MDNCWISCQVMADVKKVYDSLTIINLYILCQKWDQIKRNIYGKYLQLPNNYVALFATQSTSLAIVFATVDCALTCKSQDTSAALLEYRGSSKLCLEFSYINSKLELGFGKIIQQSKAMLE